MSTSQASNRVYIKYIQHSPSIIRVPRSQSTSPARNVRRHIRQSPYASRASPDRFLPRERNKCREPVSQPAAMQRRRVSSRDLSRNTEHNFTEKKGRPAGGGKGRGDKERARYRIGPASRRFHRLEYFRRRILLLGIIASSSASWKTREPRGCRSPWIPARKNRVPSALIGRGGERGGCWIRRVMPGNEKILITRVTRVPTCLHVIRACNNPGTERASAGRLSASTRRTNRRRRSAL